MNRLFANKFICPKCRKIIGLEDLLYVCRNEHENDSKGKKNKNNNKNSYDEFMQENNRQSSTKVVHYFKQPQLKMFKTNGFVARCPECHKISTEVACPHCSDESGSVRLSVAPRREVISITGVKSSGKTVYIATLVRELQRFFDEMGVTCRMDSSCMEDYSNNYDLRVGFELPGGTNKGIKEPIILHISEGERDALDIILYDIAGESLVPDDNVDTNEILKHIALSTMIIYLFDPLQGNHINSADEDVIRKKKEHTNIVNTNFNVTDGIKINTSNYAHEDRAIVSFLTKSIFDIINQELDINYKGRLPIKVAPTISLIDAIEQFYENQKNNEFIKEVDYSNGVPSVQRKVNKSIENLLKKEWRETGPLVEFKTHYEDCAFFGVSSLGCEPGPNNTLPPTYTPKNVVNPVIWLLDKNRTLPKRRL